MSDRKQEILNVLTSCRTLQEAAIKLGITRQRVHQIAKEFGISMKEVHQKAYMEVLTDEMISKYPSFEALHKVTGFHQSAIKNALIKAEKLTPELLEMWKEAKAPIHGSYARYRNGCKCSDCVRAGSDYLLIYHRKRNGFKGNVNDPIKWGKNKGHVPEFRVFLKKGLEETT